MKLLESEDRMMLVLEPGELILESIQKVAKDKNIKGADIMGIGAIKDVELGAYLLEKREYVKRTFSKGEYELVNMMGNLSEKDGEPYAHIHSTIADEEQRCFGGHMFEAVTAVTVEISIVPFGKLPLREMNPNVGLATICGFVK